MRVLAIGAHPDDIDFTAGGTISRLVAAGHGVSYCLVTNGQAGGSEPGTSRLEQAKLRKDEQHRAAKVLGVSESFHLGLPDGAVTADLDLRRMLTKVIRTVRPELVVTPSPRYNLDNVHFLHPDHLATGSASLAAVYPDSRNQFAFPELGLEPHQVSEVWLVEDPEPDYFVDISVNLDLKLEALAEHSSQFGTNADIAEEVYAHASKCAELGGSIHLAAEAFKRITYTSLDQLEF